MFKIIGGIVFIVMALFMALGAAAPVKDAATGETKPTPRRQRVLVRVFAGLLALGGVGLFVDHGNDVRVATEQAHARQVAAAEAAVRAKAAKAAAEKAAKAAAAKAAAQAKAEAAAAAKERALNGPYDETDVRSNCKRVVVENLTSPSTAKWPGWFEEMDHAPRRWPKQHEWKYVNHVDSQNGFGAMVRTNFECLVFDDGQVKVNFLD